MRWLRFLPLAALLFSVTTQAADPPQSVAKKADPELAETATRKQCSTVCHNGKKLEWTCASNESCCANAVKCTGTCNVDPFKCN